MSRRRALYWNDFVNLAKACGFPNPWLVADRPVDVADAALAARLGNIRLFSATWRLWKLPGFEPACEDCGQAARYCGSVPRRPDRLVLDKHHVFQAGMIEPVCGNTLRMLRETRLAAHFDVIDGPGIHYGIFEGCGRSLPFGDEDRRVISGGSCC